MKARVLLYALAALLVLAWAGPHLVHSYHHAGPFTYRTNRWTGVTDASSVQGWRKLMPSDVR